MSIKFRLKKEYTSEYGGIAWCKVIVDVILIIGAGLIIWVFLK
jgi:hypothetical protein